MRAEPVGCKRLLCRAFASCGFHSSSTQLYSAYSPMCLNIPAALSLIATLTVIGWQLFPNKKGRIDNLPVDLVELEQTNFNFDGISVVVFGITELSREIEQS